MSDADLDPMAAMLGDLEVMRFYPRPRTRDEAQAWIDWSRRHYVEHGFGLWVLETHDGEFVGDCGLTWQQVGGVRRLEVGYHVVRARQRLGYATEAAQACVEFALDPGGPIAAAEVIAIINPANTPSRRVAERIGLRLEQHSEAHGRPVVVYRRAQPQ